MKICPYMSYRSQYVGQVKCMKNCAIFHKCQENYTLIDIADKKLKKDK